MVGQAEETEHRRVTDVGLRRLDVAAVNLIVHDFDVAGGLRNPPRVDVGESLGHLQPPVQVEDWQLLHQGRCVRPGEAVVRADQRDDEARFQQFIEVKSDELDFRVPRNELLGRRTPRAHLVDEVAHPIVRRRCLQRGLNAWRQAGGNRLPPKLAVSWSVLQEFVSGVEVGLLHKVTNGTNPPAPLLRLGGHERSIPRD
jgi:hypothetical protein